MSRSGATGPSSISAVRRPRPRAGSTPTPPSPASAVLYVFRSLVEEDIPFNTGLMRPLEDRRPARASSSTPSSRRACAGGNVETSQRIVDVLLGALAKAVPDRIPAASQGTMNNIAFGGRDPARSGSFRLLRNDRRRHGGGPDGRRAERRSYPHDQLAQHAPRGAGELSPAQHPALRPPAGLGRTGAKRGGDGIVREYEFLVPGGPDHHVRTPRVRALRPEGRPAGGQGQEHPHLGRPRQDPRLARSTSRSGRAMSCASKPPAAADTAAPAAEPASGPLTVRDGILL